MLAPGTRVHVRQRGQGYVQRHTNVHGGLGYIVVLDEGARRLAVVASQVTSVGAGTADGTVPVTKDAVGSGSGAGEASGESVEPASGGPESTEDVDAR